MLSICSDSSIGRSPASGEGGRRFESRPWHYKDGKFVPVATLLDAQHYKASPGFSSLTHIHFISVCIYRRTVWKTGIHT